MSRYPVLVMVVAASGCLTADAFHIGGARTADEAIRAARLRGWCVVPDGRGGFVSLREEGVRRAVGLIP